MKIKAITIEITGQEIKTCTLKNLTGAESALRQAYRLDDKLHLVSIERKVKGSDKYDAYIYKFERAVKMEGD